MTNWIIPSNLSLYDVLGAFSKLKILDWKQSANIEIGDIVYIYVGRPISGIRFKTEVLLTELPNEIIDDTEFKKDPAVYKNYGRYMRLKLIHEYDDYELTFNDLKEQGLTNVRGTIRMSSELLSYIEKKESIKINRKRTENELDQELFQDIDSLVTEIGNEPVDYVPTPKKKPEAIQHNNGTAYARDKLVAINALARAKHICEIDENHPSFIRRTSKKNYTEPHHLIPMSCQDKFDNSLDVEANIVSLCSNCHNQIHYGENAEGLIEVLYNKRKDELDKAGIMIEIDDLKLLY